MYDNSTLEFKVKKAEDIVCGDIILVHENESVPADMLLVSTPFNDAFFDSV